MTASRVEANAHASGDADTQCGTEGTTDTRSKSVHEMQESGKKVGVGES
jgi:hypothetical protein